MASLGAGIEVFGQLFSLGMLLVSAHYQFLKGGQMYYFPQAAVGPP
jgi:hypothetical protein